MLRCVMYLYFFLLCFFFFSSRRRHTRYWRDWSSDVCSSDLELDPHGVGLPYAMGVKLAFPEAEVACVTGESSLQMYIQELRSEERRVGKECRSRWSPYQ